MKDFEYEPASDLHLAPGERSTSVLREPGLIGAAAHRVTRGVARTYLKAAHRLDVAGLEHLPVEPPCVVIANHTSHLDALALMSALPARWCRRTYPLAAGDVFFESPRRASWSSLCLNALPVDREHGRRHAIQNLRDRLGRQGCVFVLFPEGTRSADGVLHEFKLGLGMLVAGAAVPVVPCWIDGAHRCWPRDRRWPRPGPLGLRFGPALHFDDTVNRRRGWEDVVSACTAAVAAVRDGGCSRP